MNNMIVAVENCNQTNVQSQLIVVLVVVLVLILVVIDVWWCVGRNLSGAVIASTMIPHFVLSGNVIDRNKAETTEDQQGGCCSEAIPFCACLPDIVSPNHFFIETDRHSKMNQDEVRCCHPEP